MFKTFGDCRIWISPETPRQPAPSTDCVSEPGSAWNCFKPWPEHKNATESNPKSTVETLRRFKLFTGLGADQLESFARYLEPVKVPQFGNLVRKGHHGDAMYVVVDGELRALTIIEGKESILATMGPGDCFGEISLLDQGPRSADVVANRDSSLLKLSHAAFERLVCEAPALALPFVLALSREAAQRVRHATKRYEDSIQFIRSSQQP